MSKLLAIASSRKGAVVVFVLALFCIGFVINAGYMQGMMNTIREYVKPVPKSPVSFRRDLADQLLEVVNDLRGYNVNHRISLKLMRIAAQLDIRYRSSSLALKLLQSSDVIDDADTCGEVYPERKLRLKSLFEKELIVDPLCSETKRTTPISSLVTVLLVANGQYLQNVLQGIREYHAKLPVVVAYTDVEDIKGVDKFDNVKVMQFATNNFHKPGVVWNNLMQSAETPYMLIGRDLSHFTEYVFLERLVHSLAKSSPVGVSTGATRNLTGHWKLGCHQTEIKNYFLRFAEGYSHSTEDCIFCDHISGPFMAKTSVLRQIPFSEKLPGHVLFEDWFLRVKQANVLVLNCPDVMFYIQTHCDDVSLKQNFRESWLGLAKEWQITRVFVPPDTHFLFTCKELSINCDSWVWGRKYCLIPTCCLEQVAKTMQQIEVFATEIGMEYELDSGSQLAALKLQGHSPWDLDGDIRYDRNFFEAFKKNRYRFAKNKIGLEFAPETKKFKVLSPDIYIEMWNATMAGKEYLPKDVQNISTRMNVLGVWVRGAPNPGLYTRNNYGPHHFKHAVFYSFNNNADTDDYRSAGSWLPCSQKLFHGCLDIISPDGNLHLTPHYFENLGLSWCKK